MFSTKTSSCHKRSADDAVGNQNNNNVASSSSSTNLFTTANPLNNHHDDDIMTNLMGTASPTEEEEEPLPLKGGTDPSPARKKAKIEGEAPRRSSRRGAGAAAAKTTDEEDVAIMEDAPPVDIEPAPIEPTPVIANAPPAAPTPKRAAASQVLASLGDTGVKEGEEANPGAMAEVATGEGGGVQHDYLLQNLVQVRGECCCTSMLKTKHEYLCTLLLYMNIIPLTLLHIMFFSFILNRQVKLHLLFQCQARVRRELLYPLFPPLRHRSRWLLLPWPIQTHPFQRPNQPSHGRKSPWAYSVPTLWTCSRMPLPIVIIMERLSKFVKLANTWA